MKNTTFFLRYILCGLAALLVVVVFSCKEEEVKKSTDEEEADITSCSDGIQNGSETGIDCGGDCDECVKEPGKTYFIKFKAGSTSLLFETNGPGWQSCGDCACAYLPPLDDDNSASMDVCQLVSVKASHILNWKEDTIYFENNQYPYAHLEYSLEGDFYSSEEVDDQAGSWLYINKITEDGNTFGKKMYKVEGTFQCKVALYEGEPIIVSDGKFVTRFSED